MYGSPPLVLRTSSYYFKGVGVFILGPLTFSREEYVQVALVMGRVNKIGEVQLHRCLQRG